MATPSPSANKNQESSLAQESVDDGIGSNKDADSRVIKRFGGRHLIFRTQLSNRSLIPQPYALISDFTGPVWFFYGLGQVWLTHKAYREFDGWTARVPRLRSQRIKELIDLLEDPLQQFTHHCNEQGIEGTLVLEPGMMEFHWTFGYSLKSEKQKPEQSALLEKAFQELVDRFLEAKAALRV